MCVVFALICFVVVVSSSVYYYVEALCLICTCVFDCLLVYNYVCVLLACLPAVFVYWFMWLLVLCCVYCCIICVVRAFCLPCLMLFACCCWWW